MRWSNFYLFTSREVPADAEVISHQLMARSGMLRKLAAGIYVYQPLAWRSLQKLMAIVRRELNHKGACELTMPAVAPAELWQESGRWQKYGKELLRIQDRHGRDFCFGPTHEEVVTDIVRHDVRSYRQLPLNLYQIQTKFRDEVRPRFGLMRGREFIMKDAYSFHTDDASLDTTYGDMHDAYCAIFEACGLDYTVVEADSGTIGGSSSHEFMVLAETGESEIVHADGSDYSANVEKAVTGALMVPEAAADASDQAMTEVETPGLKSVPEVAAFLGVEEAQMVKTLIYDNEQEMLVAVLVRGDREVNEVKLANLLDVQHLALASDERVAEATSAPVGFAGPVGLPEDLRVIADESVRSLATFACGANKADAHLINVQWQRDTQVTEWADILLAREGDPAPNDGGALHVSRGIEVGHIFKLGSTYSAAMGCEFLDENGKSRAMEMGCYGLGIGRTVAAAIEQNHDDDGIIWPLPLAPFQVLLIALNPQDEAVVAAADELYGALEAQGIEVLYDDRKERPGVKFKDADLIGIPVRAVVGKRGLADDTIELSLRKDREKHAVPRTDAVDRIAAHVRG